MLQRQQNKTMNELHDNINREPSLLLHLDLDQPNSPNKQVGNQEVWMV